MIDRYAIAWLRPGLDRAAKVLAAHGATADAITWTGFGLGMGAAAAIASRHFGLGLALLLLNRLLDGLDGAVARQTRPTDRGAFLDITLDFLFYASIPLAFAIADPAANALAAATLLAAFIGTATTFLAFATLAAQRGLKSLVYPGKGIYYLGGLTEGGETLLCFSLMCLWSSGFAVLAYSYSALCLLTTGTRLRSAWTTLRE